MRNIHLLIGVAGALAIAGLAEAQPATGLSPAQVVAARQAALDNSAANFGGMLHAADGGADAKSQAFQANALARWARVLPTLFPAGTGPGGAFQTAARPEIWSDRAGFDQKAAAYGEAAGKLAELAKAADTPGFKAQLVVVRQSCAACHDAYRVKPPG